jgi:hypothetical protein
MEIALLTISSKNEQTSIRMPMVAGQNWKSLWQMRNMEALFLCEWMVITGEGAFRKLASKIALQWGHGIVNLRNSQIRYTDAATQELTLQIHPKLQSSSVTCQYPQK